MDPVLRDAFGHEAWANAALIDFCQDLAPEQLRATTSGAYGGVAATVSHHLEAAAWYQHLLGAERLAWEEAGEEIEDLPELRRRAGEVERRWTELLDAGVDPDAMIEDRPDEEPVQHIRAGVLLAQTLNHGSEHRGQVCTILTTLGLQPPELDAWAYGYAAGRVWTDPEPAV